jgi:hypothetical protein
VIGTLVVVAFAMGTLLGRGGQQQPIAAGHEAGAADQIELPLRAPTRHSAVTAALAFLGGLRWDVAIDSRRLRAVLSRVATPAAVDALGAEISGSAPALRAAVAVPPIVVRRAVLGTRVDRFEVGRADVSVWGMALFATGRYGPVTQWSTSRISLAWAGGEWRVTDVRTQGGPSPESPLSRLATADQRFAEVDRVP